MKKLILGAFAALALCIAAVPSDAAPLQAPIQPALFQADASTATVQTVQYRPYGYRAPPRGFYRPHRRFYRPPPVRGFYRGPGPRGYRRY